MSGYELTKLMEFLAEDCPGAVIEFTGNGILTIRWKGFNWKFYRTLFEDMECRRVFLALYRYWEDDQKLSTNTLASASANT